MPSTLHNVTIPSLSSSNLDIAEFACTLIALQFFFLGMCLFPFFFFFFSLTVHWKQRLEHKTTSVTV